MSHSSPQHLFTAPPASGKPLMIYDGDCHFCGKWIARWKASMGEVVDFAPSQEVMDSYPEIPPEQFERSVVLIHTDGSVHTGAKAVFSLWEYEQGFVGKMMKKAYERSNGFAKLTEFSYAFVAKNRYLFSLITRLLWGETVEKPTFAFASWLFPRLLGVVTLLALVSMWIQAAGLFGVNGILPYPEYFEGLREHAQANHQSAFWLRPSGLYFFESNAAMHVFLGFGCVGALALMFGILPRMACLFLWAVTLSLFVAGQRFLSFQWDILLMQSLFLCSFVAPVRWRDQLFVQRSPPKLPYFLICFSFVAFMVESSAVKWMSFDSDGTNTWRALTALDYHYWTQPLPHPLSWFAHQLPNGVNQSLLAIVMVVELIVPWFLFGPRRIKGLALLTQVCLQIGILLTGNYGWFNLLVLVLCVPFFEDQFLPVRWRNRIMKRRANTATETSRQMPLHRGLVLTRNGFMLGLLALHALELTISFERVPGPQPIQKWANRAPLIETIRNWTGQRLHWVNGYGLFRVMTTTRPEIQIEASEDGKTWKRYRFRYKVAELDQMPPFVAPHMPRLDWQMWFAALRLERLEAYPRMWLQRTPWFAQLLERLASEEKAVLGLFASTPDFDTKPTHFRITLYRYTFTNWQEHNERDAYWNRELVNQYTLRY